MTIILHACGTAEWAKEMSNSDLFKNVEIIVPSKAVEQGTIAYIFDVERVVGGGHWLTFKNGERVDSHRSSWSPMSKKDIDIRRKAILYGIQSIISR